MNSVILVELPFKHTKTPSLGLSLLREVARTAGFDCHIRYDHLPFERLLGERLYSAILDSPTELLVGDFVFAKAAGARAGTADEALVLFHNYSRMGHRSVARQIAGSLQELQDLADNYIRNLARELAGSVRVIGLSMMFQILPSIALAANIKKLAPETVIVAGGSHCAGGLGATLLRRFPFIDFVCTGEGEVVFPQLLRGILHGHSIPVDGISHAHGKDTESLVRIGSAKPATIALEDLPTPDYSDWIAVCGHHPSSVALTFETSRGCWFGEKSHCVFCGLNAEWMEYRSKSPTKVLRELSEFQKLGVRKIIATDQIFNHSYFSTLLPQLSQAQFGLSIFYEIKSNVTFEQLQLLKAAGIDSLQPGIETLSTSILQKMRKGVTAVQNIQLLKWAAELGVVVSWNLLYGCPGEKDEDYAGMNEIIPLISHLQPPASGCRPMRADRFSPIWSNPASFGLKEIRPFPAYSILYGSAGLDELAYHFEYDIAVLPSHAKLFSTVDKWIMSAGQSFLFSLQTDRGVLVADGRTAAERSYLFDGLAARVLLACHQAKSLRQIQRLTDGSLDALPQALYDLTKHGLLIHVDEKFLSLPVPMDQVIPAKHLPHEILLEACAVIYRNRMRALWGQHVARWSDHEAG
jgi:ribosomal peptide maturation radical SAM protein 1